MKFHGAPPGPVNIYNVDSKSKQNEGMKIHRRPHGSRYFHNLESNSIGDLGRIWVCNASNSSRIERPHIRLMGRANEILRHLRMLAQYRVYSAPHLDRTTSQHRRSSILRERPLCLSLLGPLISVKLTPMPTSLHQSHIRIPPGSSLSRVFPPNPSPTCFSPCSPCRSRIQASQSLPPTLVTSRVVSASRHRRWRWQCLKSRMCPSLMVVPQPGREQIKSRILW